MRLPKSCQQCRSTKRKCVRDSDNPLLDCLTCKSRRSVCSKPWHSSRARQITRSSDTLQCLEELSSNDLNSFVSAYFQFIHDRPHSLFHKKTLWYEIRRCSVPECLLAAIYAIGCRFSISENHRSLSSAFLKKSTMLFGQQLEVISLEGIQTCILLANLHAVDNNNALEALYFGRLRVWYPASEVADTEQASQTEWLTF